MKTSDILRVRPFWKRLIRLPKLFRVTWIANPTAPFWDKLILCKDLTIIILKPYKGYEDKD